MVAEVLKETLDCVGQVLGGVNDDQLNDVTPCASWNVSDLINHIVGGTEFFAVVAETGDMPDDDGEETDYAHGDFRATFAGAAARALRAFDVPGAMEKIMTLPFGEVDGATCEWIASRELFVHAWDLASATRQPRDLNPALALRLLDAPIGAIPDANRGEEPKPFGPVVVVAANASPADRLAGFLGRNV